MMKTRIVIILLLVGFFVAFQIYLGFYRSKTIDPKYRVVRNDNEFEIRSYSKPTNPEHRLFAVLKFGGYASPRVIKIYSDKLKTILSDNGFLQSGDFRCLQYHSPYQIVGRRNEIIVSIEAFQIQEIVEAQQ